MLAEDTISDGHLFLSDFSFLVAAVLFFVAALLAWRPLAPTTGNPPQPRVHITAQVVAYIGLALVAFGVLVL